MSGGASKERKRIRAATVAHLKAKATVPDAKIFNSRIYPIPADMEKALNVFTPLANGKNENQNSHIPSFDYDLSLRIDAHIATRADDWADQLDDMCEEVDLLVFQDAAFLAELQFSRVAWHRTTIQVSGDGEEAVATAQIEYGLGFGWDYEPGIADEFAGVDVDVDAIDPADANTGHEGDEGGYPGGQPGPDGRIEARVNIELREPEPEP